MAKSHVAGEDDSSWTTLRCRYRMKASIDLYASLWSPFLVVVTGNDGMASAVLVPVSTDDYWDQYQKSACAAYPSFPAFYTVKVVAAWRESEVRRYTRGAFDGCGVHFLTTNTLYCQVQICLKRLP